MSMRNEDVLATVKDIGKKKEEEEEADSPQNAFLECLKAPSRSYIFRSDVVDNIFFHIFFPDQKTPFVVCSNGEYKEIRKEEKESYFEHNGKKYYFKTELAPPYSSMNTPDKRGAEMFVEKEIPEKKNLYQRLLKQLEEYYDFYSEEECHIIACNIVHSYILSALGNTFYLLLHGEANTGKSSLQILLSLLQYNGVFSGKTSMPAMIRNIHTYQVAQNIDEFEKLSDDEKKNAMGILNTGYLKSGTYQIVERSGGKDFVPKEYFTFGTKSFSVNSAYFDESFLSRCITIHTVRNKKDVKSVHSLSGDDREAFQKLQNEIFVFCLFRWEELKESIESVKKELSENQKYGRRADIISLIAGVYEYFVENTDLRKTLLERDEFENEASQDDDRLYLLFRFLVERMEENTISTMEISSSKIAEHINETLGIDMYSKFKATSQSIVKMMRSHRIIGSGDTAKQNTAGAEKGKKIWIVQKKKVADMVDRSRFNDLKEKVSPYFPKSCYSATEPLGNGSVSLETPSSGHTLKTATAQSAFSERKTEL